MLWIKYLTHSMHRFAQRMCMNFPLMFQTSSSADKDKRFCRLQLMDSEPPQSRALSFISSTRSNMVEKEMIMLAVELHNRAWKHQESEKTERFCKSDGLLWLIDVIRSHHYLRSARRASAVLCWHGIRCNSLLRWASSWLHRNPLLSNPWISGTCFPSPTWRVLARAVTFLNPT